MESLREELLLLKRERDELLHDKEQKDIYINKLSSGLIRLNKRLQRLYDDADDDGIEDYRREYMRSVEEAKNKPSILEFKRVLYKGENCLVDPYHNFYTLDYKLIEKEISQRKKQYVKQKKTKGKS
jgi:hypothetical protein